MTFIRRPRALRISANEDSSTLSVPIMALISVLCERRAFWLLLVGTLIFVTTQRAAPRSYEQQFYGNSNDSIGRGVSSGSPVSTAVKAERLSSLQTARSDADKKGNNKDEKQQEREIIRYNITATARKYQDTPQWMDRYPFLPAVDDVPDENRICFVHVGKTAGSTLACYLGFQYPACEYRMMLLPGSLPQWTTNLMHTHYDTCMRETNIGMYLFTLRDPVARMQSWFRYEHPYSEQVHDYRYKKLLFVDCNFHSLEELGGPRGLGGKGSTECSRRAWWAMQGVVGFKVRG